MNSADYLTDKYGQVIIEEESGLAVAREAGPFVGSVDRTKSPTPVMESPVTGTRIPITSRFRKIGNPSPGFWGDIKGWWTGLKSEYRWGILGGIGAIGVVVAAVQGKGKGSGSTLRKV